MYFNVTAENSKAMAVQNCIENPGIYKLAPSNPLIFEMAEIVLGKIRKNKLISSLTDELNLW